MKSLSAFVLILVLLLAGSGCRIAILDCLESDATCNSRKLLGYLLLALPRTNVPDTGQLICSDDSGNPIPCSSVTFPGQDAFYFSTPAPISLAVNPSGLTVSDGTTGLIWQRCPRNAANDCSGAATTDLHGNQETYCAGLTLDGLQWRLPTLRELIYIANYELSAPSFDTAIFPQTITGLDLWSSTTFHFNGTVKWAITTSNATYAQADPVGFSFAVQCVSGANKPTRWTVLGDFAGIAYDPTSVLMATRCTLNGSGVPDEASPGVCLSTGTAINWQTALQSCENLDYGGYSDWRLPSIKELATVKDYSYASPAFDPMVFPMSAVNRYWSSTTNTTNIAAAWAIDVSDSTNYTTGKTTLYFTRCVRGP